MKKKTAYQKIGNVCIIVLLGAIVLSVKNPSQRENKTAAAATMTVKPTSAASPSTSAAPSASGQPSASEQPSATPTQEPAISVMDAPIEERVTRKGLIYEYTGLEAHLIGCTNAVKTRTSLKIPGKIRVNDIYYDVTMIDCDALQGCTELKTVTIGRYMKQIRYGAFQGDSELKKVVFKGKKLNNVGDSAFKYTAAKLTFYMPAAVVKKYKKILRSGTPGASTRYKKV